MMRIANYDIIHEDDEKMVILDVGPWTDYPTITNSAEEVVSELAGRLGNRRLFYYDTNNDYDEIIVKNEKFAGFRPGPR